MTIRTQADIAELEKVPLAERVRHGNMLELLRHAGGEHANRDSLFWRSRTGRSRRDLMLELQKNPARSEPALFDTSEVVGAGMLIAVAVLMAISFISILGVAVYLASAGAPR